MSSAPQTTSTIYDRVGGAQGVQAAVEIFYQRILADQELTPFFHDAPISRLKAHQFAFLSQVLGGPSQYDGASISQAHARLAIEQRHFDAVAGHLAETLRELGAGEDLIGEVISQVAPLSSQIVKAQA